MNEHSDLHEGMGHISDEMAGNGKPEPLEVRLRRLESALAAMQDTKLMEERLMERVLNRMDQPMPPQARLAESDPSAAGMMLQAGKSLLPGAVRAFSSELSSATNPQAGQGSNSLLSPQIWLITDLIFDIRTWIAMYVDYRYRATWAAKLVPPLLLIVILWIMIWPPFPLFNYILPPVLLLIIFKTLLREGSRYRAALPYLPKKMA
ncbi:MAG TPA: hypothetical protein VGZ47_03070 [Gemmataceae bacterium]|jgi:hypothetical protein|nr:hypothetical protein [Gemmataceae bacterium]